MVHGRVDVGVVSASVLCWRDLAMRVCARLCVFCDDGRFLQLYWLPSILPNRLPLASLQALSLAGKTEEREKAAAAALDRLQVRRVITW